jgi:diguanylate cyclase (GGDEF)-like protein/PAS domain S-box-containing protein
LHQQDALQPDDARKSVTGLAAQWRSDVDGQLTDVLAQPEALADALSGSSLLDWLARAHPCTGPAAARQVAAALAQRAPFRVELAMPGQDETRHVVVAGLPDADGYRGSIVDVTEARTQLEHALRSEAGHRLLVDNSTDLIAHCGMEGRYVHISPSYERMMGWTPADMVGEPVIDFLHPDDQPPSYAALAAVLAGEQVSIEVRKRTPDGRYVWLGTNAGPVTDPDTGRCLGAVMISRDITREKEMLRQIQAMAEQNTALIENSPDIMLLLCPQGTILHVNQAVRTVLGYEPADVLGKTGMDFIRAEASAATAQKIMELSRRDGDFSTTLGCRHQDGTPVQLAISMRRPPGSDVIYASARDVTESWRTRLALQQSHEHTRTLLESISDGFFSVNEAWQITYANLRAADFVGVDRDASLGKVLWDVAPDLGATAIGARYREAMAERRSTAFELPYEPMNVWLSERVYAHEDGLSIFFHDITERKLAEARLEQLATRDTLTGLPNRAWINRRVETMLGQPGSDNVPTVFFIDLNRFKAINDSLGHATGDRLLQQVGQRLAACMRPDDEVARLGGDEFVVAARCADRGAAAAIAERLLAVLKTPFLVDGLEMSIGASIGISLADGAEASPAQLFQNADTAMYQAKALGNGAYQFFEPEMSTAAKRRLTLELALPRALELGQLEVVYQPRVHLRSLQPCGMEALLSWRHPEYGPVSPLEFIPIAEERGQIEAIGAWVLQEACRFARRVNAAHGLALRVSVNVSARQLRSPELVGHVRDALAAAGLPAACLELEITESALIEDVAGSAAILRTLKELGIALSLDDFGTGYSSLSYLKRFPVDVLKLDRSFLNEDEHDTAFIRALVDMAHVLGLAVVAEGIETEGMLEVLHHARCDEGQGYLIARPLSVHDFERFLAG